MNWRETDAVLRAQQYAFDTDEKHYVIRRLTGRLDVVRSYHPTDDIYAEVYPGGRVVLWGETQKESQP